MINNCMANHCWYETIIDISSALKSDWSWPTTTKDVGVWQLEPHELFNSYWLEMMADLCSPVVCAVLFKRPSYENSKMAHIDTLKSDISRSVISAFNWVIN